MTFLGVQHQATQGNDSKAIQAEAGDGCTAYWGEADQLREVLVPAKMLTPVVATGVIDNSPCFRINTFGKSALGAIATEARQRQILQGVCTAMS
jgi:hypothetical protein